MTVTIKLSEAGYVEIPKDIREAQGLSAGTELEVIARDGEIVLRSPSASALRKAMFPPITIEEFLKRVPAYSGPPVTLELMDEAVLKEARRRWHEKGC